MYVWSESWPLKTTMSRLKNHVYAGSKVLNHGWYRATLQNIKIDNTQHGCSHIKQALNQYVTYIQKRNHQVLSCLVCTEPERAARNRVRQRGHNQEGNWIGKHTKTQQKTGQMNCLSFLFLYIKVVLSSQTLRNSCFQLRTYKDGISPPPPFDTIVFKGNWEEIA